MCSMGGVSIGVLADQSGSGRMPDHFCQGLAGRQGWERNI